ncbi:MAG: GNAT family N-acetyltransferase [Veillonella sp.]|uniref:GNAT family N-acetyltransferase n=1 Tax=Veillonella sp. TaxID=1926307 RepID=UPI0025D748C7|nr:GNAT family N-acetyltransferase [Veillonella sp.]MBS4913982.1 GNAT family N-acetyltransferase [Veillonella sp.]
MEIYEVTERTPQLIEQLLHVWEDSVKATHLFLSPDEIEFIKQYVPQGLQQIGHLVIAENEAQEPIAFMGIQDQHLEMLFIAPQERSQGLGRQLFNYGVTHHKINHVTVNEQNPEAKGFYEHMGFEVYKWSELDEQGNPYPILYMKLKQ